MSTEEQDFRVTAEPCPVCSATGDDFMFESCWDQKTLTWSNPRCPLRSLDDVQPKGSIG